MKRSLLMLPVLFLFLFNACSGGTETPFPDQMWTAFAQTNTAMMVTPSPTSTPNPHIPNMISTLNVDLMFMNPLEGLLDAKYYVWDMSIEHVEGYSELVLLVNVHCECVLSDDCCHPGRTFVVVMNAMKKNYISILAHVPSSVGNLLVVCSENKRQVGSVSVAWIAVSKYLRTEITDYELKDQVRLIESP